MPLFIASHDNQNKIDSVECLGLRIMALDKT